MKVHHQYLCAARAGRELNRRPLFTLDQGLRGTIDWYQAFPGKIA